MPFRQIDVEDHQVGAGRLVVTIGYVEKSYRLLPVFDHENIHIELGPFDGPAHEVNVCRVILYDQNLPAFARPVLRREA